jgi:hypothetical protein
LDWDLRAQRSKDASYLEIARGDNRSEPHLSFVRVDAFYLHVMACATFCAIRPFMNLPGISVAIAAHRFHGSIGTSCTRISARCSPDLLVAPNSPALIVRLLRFPVKPSPSALLRDFLRLPQLLPAGAVCKHRRS